MAEARRGASITGDVGGARVLVVEARYYDAVGEALWTGAKRALERAGVMIDRIAVPGALEIPQAIAMVLETANHPYDGAVALGCVIRGETSHYDIVAGESARALMDLAIRHAFPIGNGILTVDSEAQALARAVPERGDKGGDAARAVLSLIAFRRKL
ncbi:MAG TPA: 6,7-dimethyl-8-ribityllumazine synthase [Xanthobacteraceae bacterium]|nr:6,7-dimethyl-8-ribityllumazine synthase [Xanthobacteraceae bacterium]